MATKLLAVLELEKNRAGFYCASCESACVDDACNANLSLLGDLVQQASRLHDDLNMYGESPSDEEISEHESDSEEASGSQDGDSESAGSDDDDGGSDGDSNGDIE